MDEYRVWIPKAWLSIFLDPWGWSSNRPIISLSTKGYEDPGVGMEDMAAMMAMMMMMSGAGYGKGGSKGVFGDTKFLGKVISDGICGMGWDYLCKLP